MANLPEKITDITDEGELIALLTDIYWGAENADPSCDLDDIFTIADGFIYINELKQSHTSYIMWFARLDDLQAIYEIYKQCLVDNAPRDARYNIKCQSMKLPGRDYFMLGGSFTLINASCERSIYEENDLIFCAPRPGKYIIKINEAYNSIYHTLSDTFNTPYTPVKSVYKFRKLLMPAGKKYFIIGDTDRYTVDAYDKDNSFMCADTYDIINAETGERVHTWPLTPVVTGKWDVIKLAISAVTPALRPIERIPSKRNLRLFYSKQWNSYIIISDNDKVHELSFVNAGQTTKPEAATADM